MALVWVVLTPIYNRIVANEAELVLRLTESPNATRLYVRDTHILRVTRLDIGGGQTALHESRMTDLHFDWILLATLFLATPGVPARDRLRSLGWSAAVLFAFHWLLAVFFVKSIYANELGEWSLRHYGALARNFWGLGKHLLNLPIKFALPFALWAFFHLDQLRGTAAEPEPARPKAPKSRGKKA